MSKFPRLMTTAEQLSGKQNPGPTMTKNKPRGASAGTPEQRLAFARMGGLTVSRDKNHMATIGHKGGKALLAKYGPEHFRELSRKAQAKRKLAREDEHGSEVGLGAGGAV